MSEADIKILNDYLDKNDGKLVSKKRFKFLQAIENLINENKEQEKMIELMAKGLFGYANLGVLIDCPAEYDGIRDLRSCPKDKKCLKCIIEYFEKKAKGG